MKNLFFLLFGLALNNCLFAQADSLYISSDTLGQSALIVEGKNVKDTVLWIHSRLELLDSKINSDSSIITILRIDESIVMYRPFSKIGGNWITEKSTILSFWVSSHKNRSKERSSYKIMAPNLVLKDSSEEINVEKLSIYSGYPGRLPAP